MARNLAKPERSDNVSNIFPMITSRFSVGEGEVGGRLKKQPDVDELTCTWAKKIHAEIEVEAVPDVSGKDGYHIRFGLYVLLFLSCRAEVTAPREDVIASGADIATRTGEMEDHASVLKWLD
jgi:hypothetical protein